MKEVVFSIGQKVLCTKKEPFSMYDCGVQKACLYKVPKFGDVCTVTGAFMDSTGDVAGIHNVITLEGYGEFLYASRRFEAVE